jgi:hypothetical protein
MKVSTTIVTTFGGKCGRVSIYPIKWTNQRILEQVQDPILPQPNPLPYNKHVEECSWRALHAYFRNIGIESASVGEDGDTAGGDQAGHVSSRIGECQEAIDTLKDQYVYQVNGPLDNQYGKTTVGPYGEVTLTAATAKHFN